MHSLSGHIRCKAVSLLVNQLKHEYSENGLPWNEALSVAIEESVEYIVQAAVEAVRETLEVEVKWRNRSE